MERNGEQLKYWIYLIVGIGGFCTFEVVSKTMDGAVSPLQITFWRFLIGGLVLLPFAVRDYCRNRPQIRWRDVGAVALLGCLLVYAMNFYQYGVAMTWAALAAVLFSAHTIFVMLFAMLLLKEPASRRKGIGLALGIFGVAVSAGNGLFRGGGSRTTLGVALVVLAMVAFAFYTVAGKGLSRRYGSILPITAANLLGVLTLIPLLAVQRVNPLDFDILGTLPQMLYLSVFDTGIVYYFYFAAVAHLDTSLAAMTFFVKPPIASLLAFLFLKETISPLLAFGIALILMGLAIANGWLKRKTALPE